MRTYRSALMQKRFQMLAGGRAQSRLSASGDERHSTIFVGLPAISSEVKLARLSVHGNRFGRGTAELELASREKDLNGKYLGRLAHALHCWRCTACAGSAA